MNTAVDKWLEEHSGELTEAVRESLSIRSVEGTPEDGAPLGREVAEALDHALASARALGFETTDLDRLCGWCDMGEGEELLGIAVHLDVVPEGTGWDRPPYAAELVDGVIYGRGTMDDKGPAFAALYAMKAVKEAGLPMRRRVRLIFGCNEETGMKCLHHYNAHAEAPTLAFSPDASYPVVNSEKNIYHGSFGRKFASRVRLTAGERANIVPGTAEAIVPFDEPTVLEAAKAIMNGVTVALSPVDGGTKVTATGLGAHASTPELGRNALTALFALLSALPLEGEDAEVAKTLHERFAFDFHGESMGIDCEDKSGRLTMNAGVMRWTENGIERFVIDIRHPQSNDGKKMHDAIAAALNMEQLRFSNSSGYYIPEDSELVSNLLAIYAERTGTRLPPLAIGGGTYARHLSNAVGFGCEMPDCEMLAHMPNERISVDELLFHAKLIADAIIALACK